MESYDADQIQVGLNARHVRAAAGLAFGQVPAASLSCADEYIFSTDLYVYIVHHVLLRCENGRHIGASAAISE